MEKKRIAFLVNLYTGKGRGRIFYRRVRHWLVKNAKQKKIEPVFFFIEKEVEQSAVHLSRTIAGQGYDILAVIGGDGTLNKVVNGIAGYDIPVLLFQAGTANDFAKTMKMPINPEKVLDLIEKGKIERVDLGKVNGRIFINIFGIGFDAMVVHYAEKLKRKLRLSSNYLLYLVSLLWVLFFKLKYYGVTVQYTPEKKNYETMAGKVTLVAVCNGTRCGGVLRLAPRANTKDGLLELCIVESIRPLRGLVFLYKAIRGTHLSLLEFQSDFRGDMPQASTVIISSTDSHNIPSQADGEPLPWHREYRVSVLPEALAVIVPQAR